MSTINISFNGTEYSIDESAVSSAIADLQEHLTSNMSGSGATINFYGNSYNVDSTKLSAAVANFVHHLGTIAGSGVKVIIGGTEYSVDATKLADTISDFQAALDELQSGGEISYWQQVKNACDADTVDQMLSVGEVIEDTYHGSPITFRVVNLTPNEVILQPTEDTEVVALGDKWYGASGSILTEDYPAGTRFLVEDYNSALLIYETQQSHKAGTNWYWTEWALDQNITNDISYRLHIGQEVLDVVESYDSPEAFGSEEEYQNFVASFGERYTCYVDPNNCVVSWFDHPDEFSPPENFSEEFAKVCSSHRAPCTYDLDLIYYNTDTGENTNSYEAREQNCLQYYWRDGISEEEWPNSVEPNPLLIGCYWLGDADDIVDDHNIPVMDSESLVGAWVGERDYYTEQGIRNLYIISGN